MFKSGLLDFGPVFVFVFVFEIAGFFKATYAIMFTTILITLIAFKKENRIPYFALILTMLTVVFGYFTIELHDPKFIQIKDTIQDGLFAVAILGSILLDKPLLKSLFGHLFDVSDKVWRGVALNWGLHFLVLATANEYVRTHFHPHIWVRYKLFAMFLTLAHGLLIAIYYRKEVFKK
jgi:intracellular septation protein